MKRRHAESAAHDNQPFPPAADGVGAAGNIKKDAGWGRLGEKFDIRVLDSASTSGTGLSFFPCWTPL